MDDKAQAAADYLRRRMPEAPADLTYRGVPLDQFGRDDLLRMLGVLQRAQQRRLEEAEAE